MTTTDPLARAFAKALGPVPKRPEPAPVTDPLGLALVAATTPRSRTLTGSDGTPLALNDPALETQLEAQLNNPEGN